MLTTVFTGFGLTNIRDGICFGFFVTAKELGIEGETSNGLSLQKDETVRVCCASMPMGFGWSLYFAQRINEQRMSESNTFADSLLINADSRVIVFEQRNPNSI